MKSHRSVVGPRLALPVQDGPPDDMMMAPSIGDSRALASGSSSDAIVPAAQALVVVQHSTTRSEDAFLSRLGDMGGFSNAVPLTRIGRVDAATITEFTERGVIIVENNEAGSVCVRLNFGVATAEAATVVQEPLHIFRASSSAKLFNCSKTDLVMRLLEAGWTTADDTTGDVPSGHEANKPLLFHCDLYGRPVSYFTAL